MSLNQKIRNTQYKDDVGIFTRHVNTGETKKYLEAAIRIVSNNLANIGSRLLPEKIVFMIFSSTVTK